MSYTYDGNTARVGRIHMQVQIHGGKPVLSCVQGRDVHDTLLPYSHVYFPVTDIRELEWTGAGLLGRFPIRVQVAEHLLPCTERVAWCLMKMAVPATKTPRQKSWLTAAEPVPYTPMPADEGQKTWHFAVNQRCTTGRANEVIFWHEDWLEFIRWARHWARAVHRSQEQFAVDPLVNKRGRKLAGKVADRLYHRNWIL